MWLFDYYVWLMLNMKFNGPANMIARNDAMEQWMKHFSLNGVKTTICKP
jgi:hypothetical protein